MSTPETVGVDLGGTKVLVGVVGEHRKVLYEDQERSAGQSQDELMETLEREVREALEARPNVAAVGLGIPCTIDRERGVAITAVNLPIENLPIRDLMHERLGIPVFVDNDANVAALAEHRFGAAKGTSDAVMLTIGTGIGGGVIIDGELYRGSTGAASEPGHMVIDFDGPPCQGNCPNNGCLETFASGTALAREGRVAAEGNPESALGRVLAEGGVIDGKAVTDAANDRDPVAVAVVEEAGRRLGAGLSGLANIFEPEVIVIGGGVAKVIGDLMVAPAREELRTRALPPMNETPVRMAELGPEAGMVGAAEMARLELEQGG
ncbi:MAG TPA: ROK family protein [Solirubrobacterales bacterium]|jgi:glucokinase